MLSADEGGMGYLLFRLRCRWKSGTRTDNDHEAPEKEVKDGREVGIGIGIDVGSSSRETPRYLQDLVPGVVFVDPGLFRIEMKSMLYLSPSLMQ